MKSSSFVFSFASTIASIAAIALVSCSTPASVDSANGRTSGGVIPYTSDKCIVTDNRLGSMGAPVTLVHNGQEIKFCCEPCVKKFKADPDKYLSKL
ncbi:MAG: hypothetical protein ACI9R3_005795 [Verrucomicrobiales bacterium]|jgi:hypothetical protein